MPLRKWPKVGRVEAKQQKKKKINNKKVAIKKSKKFSFASVLHSIV